MRNPRKVFFDVVVVGAFVALAVGPWGRLFGERMDLAHMLAAPSMLHPLGSDNMGRDLLVRFAAALRQAVLPLWCGVLLGTSLGVCFGLVAVIVRENRSLRGLTRGVDFLAAVLASIPIGLVAFAWAAATEGAGLLPVLVSLACLFAVRGYLEIRDLDRHDQNLAFWQAHAALGGSLRTRVWRYGVCSGWTRALVRMLGFNLRVAVAIEASLSYLGFGIQEPRSSFGNLLAAHFDLYLKGQWQILLMIVAVLALTAAFPGSLVGLMLSLSSERNAFRLGRSRGRAKRSSAASSVDSRAAAY